MGSASEDLIHYCSDGYQPYTFSIQAHVAGTDKITSVTSDTDKLEVSFQADKKETLVSSSMPSVTSPRHSHVIGCVHISNVSI